MSTTISRQIEEVFFDEVDNKYKMHMTRHDGLGNLVCEKTFPVGDYGGSTPVTAGSTRPNCPKCNQVSLTGNINYEEEGLYTTWCQNKNCRVLVFMKDHHTLTGRKI